MKLRNFLLLTSTLAASHVSALSLGNPSGKVELGVPLDLTFHVQPDPGQTIASSCLRADIWFGETALAQHQVLLSPLSTAVRIRTTKLVHEPLAKLKLSAGCNATVSRTYTFFADPPSSSSAPASGQFFVWNSGQGNHTSSKPLTAPPVVTPPIAKRAINHRAIQAVRSEWEQSPAGVPLAEAITPPASIASAPAPVAEENSDKATEHNGSLRLEMLPVHTAEQAAPPEEAPSLRTKPEIDAKTRIAVDANVQRLAVLERQLLQLQSQLQADQAQILWLQKQLTQTPTTFIPPWLYVVLGLLSASLIAVAGALFHLYQSQRKTSGHGAESPDTTQLGAELDHAPSFDPVFAGAKVESIRVPTSHGLPTAELQVHTANTAHETQTMADFFPPDNEQEEQTADNPVSDKPNINAGLTEVLSDQALLDIQEQAEFYASIGENDQALVILQSHIAENHASSPLAYIDLLQLLYRLGRIEAFEQARTQFQNDFNVQVPDFLAFARKGHDLWSGYPEVLSQIESIWPTDDVLHLLHTLAVRSPAQQAEDHSVRFDMLAFEDLLMLYNVAKSIPAESRGQIRGRKSTVPSIAPLPDLAPAAPLITPPSTDGASSRLPRCMHENKSNGFPENNATPIVFSTGPGEIPPPSQALLNGSPLDGTTNLEPDEIFIEALHLETPADAEAEANTTAEISAPVPSIDFNEIDAELEIFLAKDRNLKNGNLSLDN